jgi:hypothetical protein
MKKGNPEIRTTDIEMGIGREWSLYIYSREVKVLDVFLGKRGFF